MITLTNRYFSHGNLRDIARIVKRYRTLKTPAARQKAWNDAVTHAYFADELIRQFMQIDNERA
jgi:ATP-dependent Clp protease adapter protein ClpS